MRFVLLMHPQEAYKQRTGTGRMTHLSLSNSEIIIGTNFSDHPRVKTLLDDPTYLPVVLYPGPNSIDIESKGYASLGVTEGVNESDTSAMRNRRLLIFVIDATWNMAKKIFRHSENLHSLPQISIQPEHPSRFKIKRQPDPQCLSTIESVHYLLQLREKQGLENFEGRHHELSVLFETMVEHQLKSCQQNTGPRRHHQRKIKRPESSPVCRIGIR